tara:strand:+ start:118 stop:681 length:564 start_codon:yes stop_codon:yes gene_type:complete
MIEKTINEIAENFHNLARFCIDDIDKASKLIITSLSSNGKVMFCGNGGSAADAQHLSAELLGRYQKNRPPLAGLALTTDTSTISAVANDFDFEDIFSRQVESLGQTNDILYAISTSGKSKNILSAIKSARKKDIKIIGVTGSNGGDLNDICDILIKVPADRPDRIQEMHIAVGQIICEIVENYFYPS